MGADTETLDPLPLPDGLRSRMIAGVNGLDVHVLEAGEPRRPALILLHGFPELAFSWRYVMPALAEAGYYVVAPDMRGFGRTTGADHRYEGDLTGFQLTNCVTDVLALREALDVRQVAAVVGHDMGAQVAGACALIRPDIFPAVVMMSAPWGGPPPLAPPPAFDFAAALAALDPPRKHYAWYYSGPDAAAEMDGCPEGVHAFLRAYYHVKSGDWTANAPHVLPDRSPRSFGLLPTYYVMELGKGMAETVRPAMPSPGEVAANRWLPDADLAVYAAEYGRVGFQGGLQWYRILTTPGLNGDMGVFAGRTLDVPARFIGGERDWGIHQTPGALEALKTRLCTRYLDCPLVEGAGHWVQQETPGAVVGLLLDFLADAR
jgi:pimeloyl-ACP methyl ester carboxylesterase